MPIYEYVCSGCGHEFERIMPMPGDDKIDCLLCGHTALRQPSKVNWSFGWRLSDDSNLKGHKDELVRDI